MKNELKVFKSSEFGELGLLIIDGKEYFPAKACAKILGYSDTTNAIKQHCRSVVKHNVVHPQNPNKTIEINFINKEDLCLLLSKSKTITSNRKQKIISEFNKQGFDLNLIVLTRKEIEFLDLLEGVLEPFNYTCYRQYIVNSKRIDFYIEDLNIAIEYDENDHKHYSQEDQKKRQKMIENELGCRFIRLSDKESNAYNVGLVMKGLAK